MNKVVAIIQAHMSSSRLPGKVLLDLCGEPALYRMIERVRHCKYIDEIVVATSKMSCDDVLIEACEKWGVSTFRGSNNDVLARYWDTTQAYPADIYVRLTSDNPLIDPTHVDETIRYFLEHDYRYVRGAGVHSDDMFCEVFSAELMKETVENATEGYEREHVTPYMYTRQENYHVVCVDWDQEKYRLDLDTLEDYELIKKVYGALYQPGNRFTLEQIIAYLDAHPEVRELNSEIVQKHYTVCSYDNFDI